MILARMHDYALRSALFRLVKTDFLNVHSWHGADKLTGLKVYCERKPEVRNASLYRGILSYGSKSHALQDLGQINRFVIQDGCLCICVFNKKNEHICSSKKRAALPFHIKQPLYFSYSLAIKNQRFLTDAPYLIHYAPLFLQQFCRTY